MTPKIDSVQHERYYLPGVHRWTTRVSFENGVVLKFTGRLTEKDAHTEAEKYYGDCIAAGWT